MPPAVDSLSTALEQLSGRLSELEARVAGLESALVSGRRASRSEALRSESRISPAANQDSRLSVSLIQRGGRSASSSGFHPLESSAGIFSTVGKAVLGFAGAFLLRALAESGSVPKLPVLVVAILYACFWMIWSTHTRDRFASVTYTITSALILSPLLWEATVRFHAMSASASAAVLVAFIILTLILAAGHELQLIPWVATLATAGTAIALIMATRELIPLSAALLGIAAATEISACLGHEVTFRAIPAVAADFSVWLLIYILGSESVPEGYRAAAPATLIALIAALPAIYGAGIALRGFAQRRCWTAFDIIQAAAAFALGTFGIVGASHQAASPALGTVFLLLAGICYWGTLSRFAADAHTRNRRVAATWAAALLLAGTFLLLPSNLQVAFLCVAALLSAIVYTRTAKLSLGLHASFYLATAAGVSPLATYVWSALAGAVPTGPDWRAATVALAAAVCYAVEARGSVDEGRRRLLWLVPAGLVAFTIAAWTVTAIVRLAGHIELGASHLSMIRTIVICLVALALGLASRRRHIELRWIAYTALGLGTLKLALEDLRYGNPASLVVSFVFYGLILILLPRLTRSSNSLE